MSVERPDRLEQLTAAACDGRLAGDDLARLEQQLEQSDDAQRYFLDYFRLDAELRDHWQNERSWEVLERAERNHLAGRGRLRRLAARAKALAYDYTALSLLVSGLFVTTIVLALALWTLPQWQPSGPVGDGPAFVAEITATHEATWDAASDANFAKTRVLEGDRLVLGSGFAEVTFDDGAVVVLEGPARFVVNGQGRGFLERGRLTATVPPAAVGFRVATRFATIVDLGTEFFVDASGETFQLGVLAGSVALEELAMQDEAEGTGPRVLRAGERATFGPDGFGIGRLSEEEAGQAPRLPQADEPLDGQPTVPADDLYRFENNARDSAGPRFAHGEAGEQVRYAEGRVGHALSVPGDAGAEACITVPLLETFDPRGDSFSVAFWMKRSKVEVGAGRGLFDALRGAETGFQALTLPTRQLRLRLDDDAGNHRFVDSRHTFDDTEFHHVAITIDRVRQRAIVYIDGRAEPPIDLSALTGSIIPSQAMEIGVVNDYLPLDGLLDELRFVREVLSEREIAELAAGPSTP